MFGKASKGDMIWTMWMMIMIAVPTYDLFSDKILPKKFYPKRARIALTNCFIKRCCPL